MHLNPFSRPQCNSQGVPTLGLGVPIFSSRKSLGYYPPAHHYLPPLPLFQTQLQTQLQQKHQEHVQGNASSVACQASPSTGGDAEGGLPPHHAWTWINPIPLPPLPLSQDSLANEVRSLQDKFIEQQMRQSAEQFPGAPISNSNTSSSNSRSSAELQEQGSTSVTGASLTTHRRVIKQHLEILTQVMDAFMQAQLRGASHEDLANPAALVLPDVQHLLLLGAASDPDLDSSGSSGRSSSRSESGKKGIPGEALGAVDSPSAATPSEPSLAETSLVHLEYARQLLAFHFRGTAAGLDPAIPSLQSPSPPSAAARSQPANPSSPMPPMQPSVEHAPRHTQTAPSQPPASPLDAPSQPAQQQIMHHAHASEPSTAAGLPANAEGSLGRALATGAGAGGVERAGRSGVGDAAMGRSKPRSPGPFALPSSSPALPQPAIPVFKPMLAKAAQVSRVLSSPTQTETLSPGRRVPQGGSPSARGRRDIAGRSGSSAGGLSSGSKSGSRLRGSVSSRSEGVPPRLRGLAGVVGGASSIGNRGTGQDGRGQRLWEASTPFRLHSTMYRLLRSTDHMPLRHGVVPDDCPPQDALAAWALSLCSSAVAMHMAATDPKAPHTVEATVAVLRDIADGMAELDAEHKRQVQANATGKGNKDLTNRAPGVTGSATTLASSTISGSTSSIPHSSSSSSKSAKAAGPLAQAPSRGSALPAAARVHACAQALALLLDLRKRALGGGGSSRSVGSSKHQIRGAAQRLVDALVAAGFERATQQPSSPGTGQPRTAAAQPCTMSVLEVQHPLVLYDAMHRLGDYHVLMGNTGMAARCLSDALAAFERFDRGTCDNFMEFDHGRDHLTFAAVWSDVHDLGRQWALQLPGSVLLHRDHIRCCSSLVYAVMSLGTAAEAPPKHAAAAPAGGSPAAPSSPISSSPLHSISHASITDSSPKTVPPSSITGSSSASVIGSKTDSSPRTAPPASYAAAPGSDSMNDACLTNAAPPNTTGPPDSSGADGVGGGGSGVIVAGSAKAIPAVDPEMHPMGDSSRSPSKAVEGVQGNAGMVGLAGIGTARQDSPAAAPSASNEVDTHAQMQARAQAKVQVQEQQQQQQQQPQPHQEAHQGSGKHSGPAKGPSRSEVVISTVQAYLYQHAALSHAKALSGKMQRGPHSESASILSSSSSSSLSGNAPVPPPSAAPHSPAASPATSHTPPATQHSFAAACEDPVAQPAARRNAEKPAAAATAEAAAEAASLSEVSAEEQASMTTPAAVHNSVTAGVDMAHRQPPTQPAPHTPHKHAHPIEAPSGSGEAHVHLSTSADAAAQELHTLQHQQQHQQQQHQLDCPEADGNVGPTTPPAAGSQQPSAQGPTPSQLPLLSHQSPPSPPVPFPSSSSRQQQQQHHHHHQQEQQVSLRTDLRAWSDAAVSRILRSSDFIEQQYLRHASASSARRRGAKRSSKRGGGSRITYLRSGNSNNSSGTATSGKSGEAQRAVSDRGEEAVNDTTVTKRSSGAVNHPSSRSSSSSSSSSNGNGSAGASQRNALSSSSRVGTSSNSSSSSNTGTRIDGSGSSNTGDRGSGVGTQIAPQSSAPVDAAGRALTDLLCVDGVSVHNPSLAHLFASWYQTHQRRLRMLFTRRWALRCSRILRVLQTMGQHARAYAHSEECYQLAALGLPSAPLTHSSESSSSSSSSSRNKKAVPPTGLQATAGAPPPVLLPPTEVVPEECFAELERQSRELLQLWLYRPASASALEPWQRAWLLLASIFAAPEHPHPPSTTVPAATAAAAAAPGTVPQAAPASAPLNVLGNQNSPHAGGAQVSEMHIISDGSVNSDGSKASEMRVNFDGSVGGGQGVGQPSGGSHSSSSSSSGSWGEGSRAWFPGGPQSTSLLIPSFEASEAQVPQQFLAEEEGMLAPPPFDSSPFDPSTQTQLAPPTLSTPSTPGLKEGSQNKAAPLAASKPSASGPRPVLEPFNSASPAAASIDAGSFAATGQPAPGTAQHAASSSENAATQGSSSSGACDGAGGDSKMAPSADHVAAADGTAGQTAGGQGGPASPSSPPTSLPTSMKAPPSASAGAAAAAAAVKPSFLQHQQRHQIKQQQPWAPSAPPAPMCQRVPVPPRLQSLHERSPLLWGPAVPKSPLNQATGLLANCCLWFTPFNSITAATLIASKSSLDGLLAELPTSSSIGSSGIQSSSSESSSTSAGNKTEGSPGTKAGSEPGRPVGATTSTTVSGSLQDSTLQQQQHHHHEQQHQEQQHQQQQHQQQQQQHHSCTQEQQQQQQQQQQSHRRTSKQPPLPPLPHRLHLQQLYAQQQALVYGALSLSLHRRILAAVRTRKISPTVLLPLLRSPMLPAHTLDAVRLILEAAQPPIPPPPSHTLSALNPNPGAQGSNGGSSSSASSTRPSSFPPSQFRPISFPTSQLRPNPNKLPTSFRPSNPSLASPPHRDPTHFTHTHNDPPQHQAGHPAPHTPHASDAINPFTSSPSQNHQGASPHQVPSSSSSQVPAHSDNHSGLSGHRPTSPTQGGGARDGGSGNNGAGRPSASAQHTPPGQPQLPAQQVGQPELLSLAHTGLKELLGRYQRATATHKAKAAGPTPPPAHAQGTAAEARAPVLASPQGASSSAGVVGGITAEAGMAGQSEGQVLQERQQRSQQQQQQQQQQQLQQQAPLRAQQLQLQELRDSVLARPRLGHLIECARMVVDAELSFGGPARAPHALAAVKMVLPEIVRSHKASSDAAVARISTASLPGHGSLEGIRDGGRDGAKDGVRARHGMAQEPGILDGVDTFPVAATPSASSLGSSSAAGADKQSGLARASLPEDSWSDGAAGAAALHPACVAEQQEGSSFLVQVFRKLLHRRQPFLALEVWKALFDASHPLAIPLGAELAAHCARSNVEAALQSLLAEAIAAAAPLLRPPPRKPSSPPPLPSASTAPGTATPPSPENSSGMPRTSAGGAPGASGGGGGGSGSGGGGSGSAGGGMQGPVGGAYNSIVTSTGNLFGAGTTARAEHSSSSNSSRGGESSSSSSSGGDGGDSTSDRRGQGAYGWGGESTSVDRPSDGQSRLIAHTDARTLQSTRLLQHLLDGLLLQAVDPQGHFQQQQQQQSAGFPHVAGAAPATVPSSSNVQEGMASFNVTASWGAAGMGGAEGLGVVGDLDAQQRLWLAKYLAEAVVRADLSTPYFPSRTVCQAVVQALLPARPASSFAATLLAASAGTNALAATTVTGQWADHGAMALEVLKGSGLKVQARLLSLAVETASLDQTGYVLGMLDAVLTAEGEAAVTRTLRADNAHAVSSSPPLTGRSTQTRSISQRDSNGGQNGGMWHWPSPMEPKTLLRVQHAAVAAAAEKLLSYFCSQSSLPLEGPLPHVLVACFRVAVFYGASSTQPSIFTTMSSSRSSSSLPASRRMSPVGGRSDLSAVAAAEAAYSPPGSNPPAHARPSVEAKVVLAHALIASQPPVRVMHPSMPPPPLRPSPSPLKTRRPTTTSATTSPINSMGRSSAGKHTEESHVLQELNWQREEDGQVQAPTASVLVPSLSPPAEYYMEAVQLLNLHFTLRPPFKTIKIVNSSAPMSITTYSPSSTTDSATTSRSSPSHTDSGSSSNGSSSGNNANTPGQVRIVSANTKLEGPPLALFLDMVLRTKAAWTAPHLRYLLQQPCCAAIKQAVPMVFKDDPPVDTSSRPAPEVYTEDPAFVEHQRKVGRSLLIKALLVGLQADVLPGIAKDLGPEYILRAAGIALQSKINPRAPRLLLKHFTAHHGLRAASLAPYFVELVNNLASVCWLGGEEEEASSPGTSTSSSGSGHLSSSSSSSNRGGVDSSEQDRAPGSLGGPYDSRGGWSSSSSLGGCEEYIVSILVSLSRSKEVDLVYGLTAPAKRLAIQLCAAQGKNKTVLRLWQAWHVRHSPLDLGKAALGWLLLACAQGKEWAVGEQLLRLLSPLVLSAPSAPPATSTSAVENHPGTQQQGQQQQQEQVQSQQQQVPQQLPPVAFQQRQQQQQDAGGGDEQQQRRQRQRYSSRVNRPSADKTPQRLGSRLAGAYLSLLAAMATAPDGQYLAAGAQRGVSAVAAAAAAAEAVAPPSAGAAVARAAVAVGQPTQDQLLEQLGTLPEFLDAAFSQQPEQDAVQAWSTNVQDPKSSSTTTTTTATTSRSSNSSSLGSSGSSTRKRRGRAGSSPSQDLDSSQRGEKGKALEGRGAPAVASKSGSAPRGSSTAAAAAAAAAAGTAATGGVRVGPQLVQGAGAVGNPELSRQQLFQQLVMLRVVELLTQARQQDENWRRTNAGFLLASYKSTMKRMPAPPSLQQKKRGRKAGSASSKKRNSSSSSSSSSSKSRRRSGEDGVERASKKSRTGRNDEGACEDG